MTTWEKFFVVLFSMGVADSLDAGKTYLISQGRWFLGGNADFGLELLNLVWIGIGLDTLLHHGLSVQFFAIVFAMWLGSVVGVGVGTKAAAWGDTKLDNR